MFILFSTVLTFRKGKGWGEDILMAKLYNEGGNDSDTCIYFCWSWYLWKYSVVDTCGGDIGCLAGVLKFFVQYSTVQLQFWGSLQCCTYTLWNLSLCTYSWLCCMIHIYPLWHYPTIYSPLRHLCTQKSWPSKTPFCPFLAVNNGFLCVFQNTDQNNN